MRPVAFLIPILILLACSLRLPAQAAPYQEMIESKRIALAYDPTNSTTRCELAYYQMLAGQPEQALESYQSVLARDEGNANARAGVLWALNSLSRQEEAAALAKQYLAASESPLLRYHLGNALLGLGRNFTARKLYTAVLDDMDDPMIRGLTMENLAWTYYNLGDMARATDLQSDTYPATGHTPEVGLSALLRKPRFHIEAAYGIKTGNTAFWSLGTGTRFNTIRIALGFEQVRLDSTLRRDNYRISATKQFVPGDISLTTQYLSGTDQRIYPGYAAALAATPKAYLGPVLLTARLAGSAATYKRHNAYQYDLGLYLRTDPFSIGYQASKVYQDNEAVGSDAQRWVHTFDIGARVWKGWYAGVYLGSGNFAWYSNPQGGITDDFEPATGYAGASLSIPITGHLQTIIYYQYGSTDEDTSHLAYAKLLTWF